MNDGVFEWKVCVGHVNNEMLPEDSWTPSSTDGFIVISCQYDGQSYPGAEGVKVNKYTEVPEDTNEFGRIAIAQIVDNVAIQLVGGSLWSDRIKIGTQIATYYFAKV